MSQFNQPHGRAGILLGGLQHEGIACGNGQREHKTGQHNREVKCGNTRPHTQRLMHGVHIDFIRGIFGQLA